ncbi:unnamed protein product [Kluyveromyces dobzhanskii CBS 2104]|uniref:WGS project CCBQ000000000 data, contig 00015 n=1 Tax=Kluyveromyces dobzhanskii CBS 2104 TaxID=1427455 RepID=A0A0A8LAZ7_9SACH|nr:unnamed protein product [Kluyveromyces dobzhanskii CBS 2104]
MTSSIPTPTTPTAQAADEHEINEISEDEMQQLDLNPDLDDVEDIKMEEEDGTTSSSMKRSFIDDERNNYGFDNMEDFKPALDLKSPFDSHTNLSHLSSTEQPPDTSNARRLSLSQQSKFVSYIDEQLLQIQRRFVQSRGLNKEHGYKNLSEVLRDLKKLIDFIWYSVDEVSNTDLILRENLDDSALYQKYQGSKSTNIGQSYYFIRIADDLLDYLGKFPLTEEDEGDGNGDEITISSLDNAIAAVDDQANLEQKNGNTIPTHGSLRKLFKVLSILDTIFARLIDGKVPGNFRISATEIVRLTGIAERTRILLPALMEENNIHGYHYEISRVYQETLERGT